MASHAYFDTFSFSVRKKEGRGKKRSWLQVDAMQQLSRGMNIDDDYGQLSIHNRQLDDE